MTKKEAQAICDKLVAMAKNDYGMYIKGYGENKCRVMKSDHTPVMNVPKVIIDNMEIIGLVKKDGLIYKFTV